MSDRWTCRHCGIGELELHLDGCPDRYPDGPDGRQEHPQDRFHRRFGILLGLAPLWATLLLLALAGVFALLGQ